MAFETNLASGSVFPVVRLPVFRVRPYSAAFVALNAYVAVRVAACAGLEVAAGFRSMVSCRSGRVLLVVSAERHVRFDLQAPLGESLVALAALLLLVTAVAALRI